MASPQVERADATGTPLDVDTIAREAVGAALHEVYKLLRVVGRRRVDVVDEPTDAPTRDMPE